LSAIGLVLQIAYRLRRHFWLGWPLSRWLGFLLVVTILWMLLRWRTLSWPVVLLALVFLAYVLVLFWAGRQRYVRFVSLTDGEVVKFEGQGAEVDDPPVPLSIQEMVPVRASGWFTVEGERQFYVDVEADFETVGTREHIVLGRVHPSRFLLFGQWPKSEMGWWYVFFEPRMIREMRLGHLHFGIRPHLALRVVYTPDEEIRQSVYLVFEETLALRRVWDDLLLDAPPAATN
jgi:signal peptidase I